jgi:signal transduction histidine kinase
MAGVDQHKHFGGLLRDALHAVEQTAQMKLFPTGTVIFKEGDPGDGLYVVLEGRVQVSALVNEKERRVLSRVGPGDFFGEMAMFDNEPRSATATAELDSKLAFISRDDLLRALEAQPRLALSLMREFSMRMRDANRSYIQELLQAERLTIVGRFARSIVHDFKNPLNIIGLSAEVMAMESASPETRLGAQKRIRKQVDRLSNMISELLEFTRGSQASVVLAPLKYSEFVDALTEDLRVEIAAKNVELVVASPPPAVTILMDQQRLTHVFYNLVGNACHEMTEGGKVFIRFEARERDILTEIEDTGKGIAPAIAGRLFEPFATHGKANGTGLGLSICKKIVEDHGGAIGARSEPGKGATFWFTLPLPKG